MNSYSIIILVISVSLSVIFAGSASKEPKEDYCQRNCTRGPNVGCTKPKMADSCKNTFKLINMTDEMQKAFLEEHNKKRQLVASGEGLIEHGSKKTPPAAKMPDLKWNNALAKLAIFNVRQCEMKHDCADTMHGHTGQNLFFYGTSGNAITNATIAKMAVEGWYSESNDTRLEDIKNLTTIYPNGKPIGHYTQLIWGNTTKVGCAASTYKKHLKNYNMMFNFTLVACNYRYGNTLGYPVYQIKNGTNPSKLSNQNKKPQNKRVKRA